MKVLKVAIENPSKYEHGEYLFTSILMTDDSNAWYIDSGATSHIWDNEHIMTNLDFSKKDDITVANGDILK